MDKRILILGGTGKTGSRVARRLQNLQVPVRLGSRNENPSFNWDEPGNWQHVLAGIEKVYVTFQPDLAVPQSVEKIKLFTETAKANNVKQLVLLSGRGETEAQACEQVVIQSGLEWTILRASWFMQNFSESFLLDSVLNGEVVLPRIKASEPFVDADDIADVAVKVLTEPNHSTKIYELTGPQLLSFETAVSIIALVLNKQVSYTEISMDEYVDALKSYQLPEDFIWLIQYLFSEVLDGRNQWLSDDVQNILGRRPATFQQYATKTAKTDIWKIH